METQSPLLLLDKDGTLVRPKSRGKYVQKPWDQKPIAGVQKVVTQYKRNGLTIVVCSNQGGVEAGNKTLQEAMQEMKFCLELFPEIEECYFCPDLKGKECLRYWRNENWQDNHILYTVNSNQTKELKIQGKYRKPGPGMLLLARQIHNASECLFVGDRPEDEAAANAANIPFVWAKEFIAK
jgi:D-glycero-D-manno-heptose 1,7-bisphosphate phosphatase